MCLSQMLIAGFIFIYYVLCQLLLGYFEANFVATAALDSFCVVAFANMSTTPYKKHHIWLMTHPQKGHMVVYLLMEHNT